MIVPRNKVIKKQGPAECNGCFTQGPESTFFVVAVEPTFPGSPGCGHCFSSRGLHLRIGIVIYPPISAAAMFIIAEA